jgi:hypothetical protein
MFERQRLGGRRGKENKSAPEPEPPSAIELLQTASARRQVVRPAWLCQPTLAPAIRTRLRGFGSDENQEEILRILIGGRFHLAEFEISEDPPFPGGVHVCVEGRALAFVPPETTTRWHAVLRSLGGSATGWVELRMGLPNGEDSDHVTADVFVRCRPDPWVPGTPYLPPFNEYPAVLDEPATEWLAGMLKGNTSGYGAALSGLDGGYGVALPGMLCDYRDSESGWWIQVGSGYFPLREFNDIGVAGALEAGWPMSCYVVIERDTTEMLTMRALLP